MPSMKVELESYRVDNERLAMEQEDQQQLIAILIDNLKKLMKNKSKHTNSDGEKNIPQKETSKRKESIKTNNNSDDYEHSKKERIELMDSDGSSSRIETPTNK